MKCCGIPVMAIRKELKPRECQFTKKKKKKRKKKKEKSKQKNV